MFKLTRNRGRAPSSPGTEMLSKEMQDFDARIDLVNRLAAKIESFRSRAETSLHEEIGRKEELLDSRNQELAILRLKISALTEQLAEMKAAKERAEALLETERKGKAGGNESLKADKSIEQASANGKVDPFEILIS